MKDMTGEDCKGCEIAEEKVKYVEAFVNLTALVNSSLDIGVIKKLSIEAAVKLTNSEAGSLLFVDAETGGLFFDIASGEKVDKIRSVRLRKGEGIAGWVAENRLPLIVDDVQKDVRFYREADEKSGFTTHNMICVPVEAKKNLIGVLQVINKRTGGFTTEDLVLMVTFSHQVAIAVENARLHEEMKETFFDIVQALAETIEMRDPYTGGHTRRVMEYSLAIGDLMGLSETDMTKLRLASILHDIGKVGVRDEVLLKPGSLTKEEFQQMMKHSQYGADIVSRIRKLRDIIPGVKYHHEKCDGSGYPEGLQGDAIPVIARIIAVADAFDAMTSDRPYRKGLSHEIAFGELNRNAGKQFDSDIVRAFSEVYEAMRTAED